MSSNLINLLRKSLDQGTEADLQKLIGVAEGKAVDFKRDRYGESVR